MFLLIISIIKKWKKIVNLYDFIEKLKNELSFSIVKNKVMFKKSMNFEKTNEILNVFVLSILISQKKQRIYDKKFMKNKSNRLK